MDGARACPGAAVPGPRPGSPRGRRRPGVSRASCCVSLGLGVGLGLALGTFSRSIIGAIVGFLIGAAIPYLIVRFRAKPTARQARGAASRRHRPDGARHARRAPAFSAGFKMVADEAPEPIATEFRQVFEEQRFGLPFDDSLLALGERVRVSDIRILITAILMHRQVGGNLAEVLDNIAALVRERFKLRRQLRVITAQGRLSGYVLALLPDRARRRDLHAQPRVHDADLRSRRSAASCWSGALVFQILGYLWIRKILDIEF